jgi:hypothetical protein
VLIMSCAYANCIRQLINPWSRIKFDQHWSDSAFATTLEKSFDGATQFVTRSGEMRRPHDVSMPFSP